MQFVKAGRYVEAIRFLEAVITQYRLDPVDEFCAGQIAIAEVLGLYDSYDAQLGICAQVLFDREGPASSSYQAARTCVAVLCCASTASHPSATHQLVVLRKEACCGLGHRPEHKSSTG